jgi:hypothetical protein
LEVYKASCFDCNHLRSPPPPSPLTSSVTAAALSGDDGIAMDILGIGLTGS